MFFERVYDRHLAHASYVVGCQATGEALVIDAGRDIAPYLAIARREGLRITHIAETHIHADFLCGSRELAEMTGGRLFLSDEGGADWQYEFPHTGLTDGDYFLVGNLRIDVLHTPGHTPEHLSFLLTDQPAGDGETPSMLFSGDFVFVGDVGRPDLLEKAAGIEGTMEAGARQLWTSLERFRQLPDHVQVWPAHGAGSACGKSLGAVPSSTIGYEKATNWAFGAEGEDAFVQSILSGQPEPPTYFARMKHLNKVDRPLRLGADVPYAASVDQLDHWLENGAVLVDPRLRDDFARGHIPGSLSLPANASFVTWAGWLIPADRPVVLVTADGEEYVELCRRLASIGIDHVIGRVAGVEAWTRAGRDLAPTTFLRAEEANLALLSGDAALLDVRSENEWNAQRIEGAVRIHLGELADRVEELPTDRRIIVHCLGGDRSAIACSVLQRAGRHDCASMSGGITAWREAALPVVTGEPAGEGVVG